MKTKLKNLIVVFLMALAFVCGVFAITPLTVNAAERADREIVAVDSGNSFNMRLSAGGVLTWDEVTGATGYKVALLNSMGQSIWEWDNDLTNNNRVLPFIVEMDNIKYDSGRYTIEVIAKDANKKASMSYYYTSNVDKLEEPHNLKWVGNNAAWEYVDGAVKYTVSIYDFEGVVATKTVTECPVDLSEYNPQNGWTFTVRAETNGDLNDKRNSNAAESPKKGDDTRFINLVDSGNALNMKVGESGVLKWDEVIGATGYQVVLKNPIGVEIYRWDNDFTNNYRMLPIITEMDNLKIDSGHYRFEVEPKGAGSVAVIANYYYTSHVEQFEAPYNLKWNGSTATWTAVNGASSYDVTLYDFNGQVKTVTVTDDWYDFSEYNPQDGWTFKVQAEGDGKSTAKRSSNATESPAKTTSYNLTVVAYGMGNTTNTGKVSMETEKGSQDFSAAVGGTFIKNTEVTVKAEANPGYEFVAWRVTAPENPEATLSTDATHTFKLENNLQLFAVFRTIPTEYSVAYHGNGATGGMTGDTVDAGGTCILKNCTYYTPYGKKFAGWAIGSADATPLKQPGDEITINADTTIYAVWENLYFTTQPTNTSGKIGTDVKLSVKIDTSQVPDEDTPYIVLEVKNGENWENVAEAKRSEWNSYNDGFTVQQNTACTKEYRYKIYNGTEWIESDTFTVEFLPIIVTFVDNTHSTITEPIEVDTVGGKISKPENPTYSGDTFYGWGWPYWDFESQTVTQDITLSAQWAGRGYYGNIPNAYAKPGEKARIDLSSVYNNGSYVYIYKYDGAEWKQDVAVSGYTWYDVPASAVEKVENYKIVIIHSQNIESNEFTVTWTNDLPTYYVSYGVGEGQGSGGADYDIEHGTNYTLDSYEIFGSMVAPNGKVFDYWSIRVGENAMDSIEIAQKKAGETITVTSNVYAIAMWKNAPTVTLSYYSIGNIVDSDTIAVGTQYTLMNAQGLEVPSGKKFKAWAIGGLGGEQKQPGEQITVTEETYIYAVWEDITYTVSFNANTGSGTMESVEYVGAYTLPACGFTAPDGKQFKGWSTSTNGEVIYGATYNVTANVELFAIWEPIPHECVGIIESGKGATCTENGWKDYYQCSCGKIYSDSACTHEITSLEEWKNNEGKITAEHTGNPQWIQTSTTHTKEYDCCHTAIVEEEAHEWQNGVCSECQYICLHGHGVKKDGQDATCTVDGWEDYYQCECGKLFADENCTSPINDFDAWKQGVGKITAEHHYGDLIPEESAVHTQNELKGGTKAHYHCDVCDSYFDEDKNLTTLLALTIEQPTHNYGDWIKDDDNHWKTCSCGLKSELDAHNYTDNDDMICDTCGYDRTIPHTHGNGQLIEGQDASCTLNGWKDYYQCSCGKIYSDSACTHEITSLEEWKNNEGKITAEHNYGELIGKEDATCSSTGFESHYECSVCHALFDEEYNVKTENELTINVDPTAHVYGDWTSNGDDTHSRVCSLNAEHKETTPCSGGEATTTEKAVCEVCNQPYGDLKVPDHVHEETGDWKHDEDYHWKECECGTPGEKVAHSGGTATENEKAICEICGTPYGELKQHTHDYSDEWKTDENNHWHECECGEKKDNVQHKDENADGKCDVCDYQISEPTPIPQPKDGLSGGTIAIIVIGSVLVLGIGGFALVWFVIKKKKFSDLIVLFKK